MASICKTCIYGGKMIGFKNTEYNFDKVIRKRNNETIIINYNNNEYGCRLIAFQSKEDVCLNNKFSEYKTY